VLKDQAEDFRRLKRAPRTSDTVLFLQHKLILLNCNKHSKQFLFSSSLCLYLDNSKIKMVPLRYSDFLPVGIVALLIVSVGTVGFPAGSQTVGWHHQVSQMK